MVILPLVGVGQDFAKAGRRQESMDSYLKHAIACNSDTWKTILQV